MIAYNHDSFPVGSRTWRLEPCGCFRQRQRAGRCGRPVAFDNATVLDHDDDRRALALRVRAAHGNLPVVMARVTPEPVTDYKLRSPRARNRWRHERCLVAPK